MGQGTGIIGIVLLVDIVKTNADMMTDFAIARQRVGHISVGSAVFCAAQLCLRAVLMTPIAAILGAVPLAAPALLGSGDEAEFRHPLTIAVVGGRILSQLLMLYAKPVVFVLVNCLRWDRLRLSMRGLKATPTQFAPAPAPPCRSHP